MKKLEMIKAAGEIVVSVGVGLIVGNAIKSTTPNNMGLIKKICIGVGSFILTSMVGDCATKYAEQKFDEAVDQVKEMIKTEEGTITVENT